MRAAARLPHRAVRARRRRPRRSRARSMRLGVDAGDVAADFTLGFCLLWRGKPQEAERYLERGREVARARGVALIETRCLVYGLVAQRQAERSRGRTSPTRRARGSSTSFTATRARERERLLGRVAGRQPELVVLRAASRRSLTGASEGRVGSSVFQWTARFPLLGVALARGDVDDALEHARAMLDPLAAAAARRDRGCASSGPSHPVASRTCSRRSTSPDPTATRRSQAE